MRRDQHPIVNRVGDDVSPETEVVPRHGVGGAIPGVVDRSRNNAGIPDRLLDRVDPQPNGVEPSCELPRHRRFSRSREACENDEHGYNLHVSIRALVHIGGGVLCRATAHKTSTAEPSTCSLKSAEAHAASRCRRRDRGSRPHAPGGPSVRKGRAYLSNVAFQGCIAAPMEQRGHDSFALTALRARTRHRHRGCVSPPRRHVVSTSPPA